MVEIRTGIAELEAMLREGHDKETVMDETRELTFGEKAVGLTFNPSGDPKVNDLKKAYAQIIDICNEAREKSPKGEAARLWSIAITEAQGAQMWAVKSATWRD